MFNDLWKKFKTQPELATSAEAGVAVKEAVKKESSTASSGKPTDEKSDKSSKSEKSSPLSKTESILGAFHHVEEELEVKHKVLQNLKDLKTIVDQPKEDKPELRFSEIKKKLGPPETHETLRRDRWPEKIHCPNCKSLHLKRLIQDPTESPHNHRYECLDCGEIFNDDSDSPMEKGIPSVHVWMQCWYLMGCSDNISYIASKLNLDPATVEFMVRQLKKFFNVTKPLSHFTDIEEWNKQADKLREQLKADLLKQFEILDANVATTPADTAEFRRQQRLRRDLDTGPTVHAPGTKKR